MALTASAAVTSIPWVVFRRAAPIPGTACRFADIKILQGECAPGQIAPSSNLASNLAFDVAMDAPADEPGAVADNEDPEVDELVGLPQREIVKQMKVAEAANIQVVSMRPKQQISSGPTELPPWMLKARQDTLAVVADIRRRGRMSEEQIQGVITDAEERDLPEYLLRKELLAAERGTRPGAPATVTAVPRDRLRSERSSQRAPRGARNGESLLS